MTCTLCPCQTRTKVNTNATGAVPQRNRTGFTTTTPSFHSRNTPHERKLYNKRGVLLCTEPHQPRKYSEDTNMVKKYSIQKKNVYQQYPNERRVWEAMHTRCYNKNYHGYVDYGGRGIKICEAWLRSTKDKNGGLHRFLQDMGPRPSPKHSIDRIDNDKEYCPENCRWATRAEQNRNKRNTRRITYKGKTLCLMDWSKVTGLTIGTIYDRFIRGWSAKRIITTPPKICKKLVTINGVTMGLKEWADKFGVDAYSTLYPRLHRGWTVEEALTIPPGKRRLKRKKNDS